MKLIKKFKLIIPVAIILVIVGFLFFKPFKGNTNPSLNYITISEGELVNSISMKGIVNSEENKNVYASSGYQINEVFVSVGEKVTKGQMLLSVDTEELASTINERKASLSKISESSLVQLENNKRVYNEAINNYTTGKDSQIISAKSRIETAEINLENAKKNYEDKVSEYANNEISQLITAENNLRNAEIDLNNRKSDNEKSKILFDAGTISKDEYDRSENALVTSQNIYNDALKTIETTRSSIESEITKLKQSLDASEVSYKEAVDSLSSAENSIKQNIDKYNDSVKSSEVAINTDSDIISIQNLEKKLEKSKVIAPIDGTITAVYAKEGANSQGLMFVIEDTENLMIKTKIKEFDANRVRVGMPVKIHSDATGSDIYEGEIYKIAPTSLKDNSGSILNSSDVEFETEIKVLTKENGLKIGMNVKLDIILSKTENALYVTFDILMKNDKGEDIVFIAEKDESGNYIAKERIVKIIQETDFYIEIEGVQKGEKIITDVVSLTDGMPVLINENQEG